LEGTGVAGAVVTGDAAHAQRSTAAYVHGRGGDYVLTVKGNQPTLLRSIADRFADARPADHVHEARPGTKRIERAIWIAPAEGIDFPAAAQIFRIRRLTFNALGERIAKEVVHGITSLGAPQATAEAVATWVRRHWGIENKIHWMRGVVFAEDGQHAYLSSSAQVMACIRNLAIGLLRLAGHQKIKATLEHIASDRLRILPLLAASHS
jgi:predicted transposase YbfD/YdcC